MIKKFYCPHCKNELIPNNKADNTYFCKCNDNSPFAGCFNWENTGIHNWIYWDIKQQEYIKDKPKSNLAFQFR